MDINKHIRILELYSGIGGMHLAYTESGLPGEIVASVDINTTANGVYRHNFPETQLLNRNIESLTPSFINGLNINTILMSPPCQPFTRNGLQQDNEDARSKSLIHLLSILPDLHIDYLLLENVKGFEGSEMRNMLVNALQKSNMHFQEFILSPSQFGIPNTRHRYYCLAQRHVGSVLPYSELLHEVPERTPVDCYEISEVLHGDNTDTDDYLIPDKLLLKRANLLDIVYKDSKRSCCFTKSYARFIEGTGSVYAARSKLDVDLAFSELGDLANESDEYLNCVKALKLRFFTPREVCRLMSFPETFSFPFELSNKQMYGLLGNSINVKVVSELIKILFL